MDEQAGRNFLHGERRGLIREGARRRNGEGGNEKADQAEDRGSQVLREMSDSVTLGPSCWRQASRVLAGLDPAIHVFAPDRHLKYRRAAMRGGWVYIMTNRPNGTLYLGVTADIARRAYTHREGLCEGFTKRYGLKQLVWYEFHEDIVAAIQRESNMKHWPRTWKVRMILAMNPEWRDLCLEFNN